MTIIPNEAIRLFSVGEVKVTYTPDRSNVPPPITRSADAHQLLRQYWSDQIAYVEEFYVMCLDRCNQLCGLYRVSTGGVSGTIAEPRVIFQVALGCHASNIILAHNHPSGQMSPSPADRDLTRNLKEIGVLMNCPVLDHFILGPDPCVYYSFADEGIL